MLLIVQDIMGICFEPSIWHSWINTSFSELQHMRNAIVPASFLAISDNVDVSRRASLSIPLSTIQLLQQHVGRFLKLDLEYDSLVSINVQRWCRFISFKIHNQNIRTHDQRYTDDHHQSSVVHEALGSTLKHQDLCLKQNLESDLARRLMFFHYTKFDLQCRSMA